MGLVYAWDAGYDLADLQPSPGWREQDHESLCLYHTRHLGHEVHDKWMLPNDLVFLPKLPEDHLSRLNMKQDGGQQPVYEKFD